MNKNHWSGYSEADLAQIKASGRIRASRRSLGTPLTAPRTRRREEVTVEGGRVSVRTSAPGEPAYPPHWLPEVQARQADEDTRAHHQIDASEDAYPREWLTPGDLNPGVVNGEGFLNRRRAA